MKYILGLVTLLFAFGTYAQDDLEDGMYAKFTTSKGEILIQLEFEKTPITVANFVGLAEGNFENDTIKISEPYYDGLKFHRVINDFMIQGGDPKGNGSGGPGYAFPDEFDSTLTHSGPGILSMANSGPATNGSQFFITHKATPWLDNKHSVFGHVVNGQEVVNAVVQGDTIKTVEIIRIGKAAKKFKASKVFATEVEKLEKKRLEELAIMNKEFYDSMIVNYPTAVQTSSGLMYILNNEGDGKYLEEGDVVEVHYEGFTLDGKKFDSSRDRKQTYKFRYLIDPFILGWNEGLGLVKVGGDIQLIIPHWLAFGPMGKGPIPPNSTIIFNVEVISGYSEKARLAEQSAEFKSLMSKTYPEAIQTESGLMYEIVENGNGSYPQNGQLVSVHYSGYLADGTKFDSSVDRGQPFEFKLGVGQVIKGWDEGILLCEKGGKIKLILPYWLAYGEQGRPPSIPGKSTLIFDVELLSAK